MIDWLTKLRPGLSGLVVEGKRDQQVLEAFLNAGRQYWGDWTAQLEIFEVGSAKNVRNELSSKIPTGISVWGLIDRDWNSPAQISKWQSTMPNLLVLPRVMIENYFIVPEDVVALLPVHLQTSASEIVSRIEAQRETWLKHGSLAQVLFENGAHDFCRGEEGYPSRLLDTPVTDDNQIKSLLDGWIAKLDSTNLLTKYHTTANSFQKEPLERHYQSCIEGKGFFPQVVVQQALNRVLEQKSDKAWLDELVLGVTDCPADLIPLFERILR